MQRFSPSLQLPSKLLLLLLSFSSVFILLQKATTMHRSLSIPELISVILSELKYHDSLDGRERVDTYSLRSVALTSKFFLESALNRLWLKIDFLEPLFRLLPASLFRYVPDDSGSEEYSDGEEFSDDEEYFRQHEKPNNEQLYPM